MTTYRKKKPYKNLAPQSAVTIESMVEHLRIKDLWYQTFTKREHQ